ncbi:hypothetical protein R3P38DRAFT_2841047 [Favolaschia claudopus]|uniref:Uncharacterized protein n=1 Tax=Favolaschia claudopus TaxID=2862362 RepID=A0AAW0DYP4_9AGAR
MDASETRHAISGYMRVASLAIAGYEYTSILILIISNLGFFYTGFSPSTCRQYYLLPSIFKVVQSMVSQAILATYNLSFKSRTWGYIILSMFLAASTLEGVATLSSRKMQFIESLAISSCASSSPTALGGWVHYLVAILYDFATSVICIYFLLKLKTSASMMSRVTTMMLIDGLVFYRALTFEVQVAPASLGYCVTWIMSQRLLIHLHEASLERRNESIEAAVTITEHITSARDVSRALRSQFETKSGAGCDLTVPDFDAESLSGGGGRPSSEEPTEVHVRIERTVRMERVPRVYELEDYSRNARSTNRSKH